MKHSLIVFLALLSSLTLESQILDPVDWTTSYERVDEQTFDLIFEAEIDEGWYVYSQFIDEGGPIPTTLFFDEGEGYQLLGEAGENGPQRKEGMDELFGMNVIKYAGKLQLTQRVKVIHPGTAVSGYLEFMTCDDEQCLPPDQVDFSFDLSPAPSREETGAQIEPQVEKEAEAENTEAPEMSVPAISRSSTMSGISDPVEVSAELKRISKTEYELIFHAEIEDGWYTYSQFLEGDGPVPTAIVIESPEGVELYEAAKEAGPQRVKEYDATFAMDLIKFKKQATFSQKIRVTDPREPVKGYFEYMACDESRCLPPEMIDFKADLTGLTLTLGGETEDVPAQVEKETADAEGALTYDMNKPDMEDPAGQCGESATVKAGTGYWGIFALGFIGGLLALLTPCVFPMIPLTVSFFTKSSGNRRKGIANAATYGMFILLVYVILSVPFHLMDSVNPDILNDISTNVWLNLAFFAIFIFFAFSFFGYYELTLPASWTNRASSAEGIGGVIGIFFMALTLALVSFSCTGPILGSLLAGALTAEGGAWQLTAGMSGFGLALALPFAIFAGFPSMLNALPKSGGWLNTVKVTLGFLELALALKFLSNADLVKHWGILKIEPFLALWILVFLGLGLYLFGLIRFPHDSPNQKISWGRRSLGILSLAFVVYLASGFRYDEQAGTYHSLKLLSGLAPPAGYSIFNPSDCPQNLNCFKDLNEGLAYARQVNKPVMIDFTGYACVNCRKMEEHVWPEKEVYARLKDDYVLISLYVDDKKELPEEEQVIVEKATGGKRKLRTYGQKWAHFQAEYFGTNAQPFYALVTPDGELLSNPVGYTPDPTEYANFLECGKDAFNSLVEQEKTDGKQLGER